MRRPKPIVPMPYLRKDKPPLKDGTKPIFVRFRRINGKEPKFPLGFYCREEDWDFVENKPKDPDLKEKIGVEVARIKILINKANVNEVEITHDLLRQFVAGEDKSKEESEKEAEEKSFLDYFVECMDYKLTQGKINDKTYKGYLTTYNALKEYRKKIEVGDLTIPFFEGFEQFMIERGVKSGKGDVEGSRRNRINHIGAVITYMNRKGIDVKDPYKTGDLDKPAEKSNNDYLTHQEIASLRKLYEEYDLNSPEHRVLCLFMFSCAAGLRLNDTRNLKWKNLDIDEDKMVVAVKMEKVRRPVVVPLFPVAVEALEWRATEDFDNIENDNLVFHWYSENRINEILVGILKRAGIDKEVTYKVSRSSFATLLGHDGVPIRTIQSYMGHSRQQTTERYIKYDKILAIRSGKEVKTFDLDRLE